MQSATYLLYNDSPGYIAITVGMTKTDCQSQKNNTMIFPQSSNYFEQIWVDWVFLWQHYYDAIMGAMACQITSLTIVYSTVYSDADQSKHQSSASLAFVLEIHRGPVNFPHKWPLTRKMSLLMMSSWVQCISNTLLPHCWTNDHCVWFKLRKNLVR